MIVLGANIKNATYGFGEFTKLANFHANVEWLYQY